MTDQLVNYYRIEKAIGYLSANFRSQPDLEVIAAKVHMSPFHFQRIFTDWVGISPKKFVQYLTLDYLKQKIRATENMIEAADIAGLSSQSRVNELFVKIEAVSPQQYKTGGAGLAIAYGYHATPFGLCFIAVTEKGICALKFIDEEKTRDEFTIFTQEWPGATLVHDPASTQPYIQDIFRAPTGAPDHPGDPDHRRAPGRPSRLQLLVKGTEFQVKVWEALVRIPFGSVASFQQVARLIGQPAATRAVGGAISANSILYLIPCHRVITKEGAMGEYHYGKVRKIAMIGWESGQLQQ